MTFLYNITYYIALRIKAWNIEWDTGEGHSSANCTIAQRTYVRKLASGRAETKTQVF
jgi:hypothetical protein